MGCFFGCLRARDGGSRPHLVSSSSKSTAKQERSVSENRLSSLFLHEDKGDYPSNNLRSSQVDKDLKDEAKCCSSIPNKSIDKFQVDKQHDQPPTPVKLFEALGRNSDSPENIPNSCLSNAATFGSLSMDSTEGGGAVTVDKTLKIDIESTSASGRNKSISNYGDHSASKPSPIPTPIKLPDEMRIPGAVFPSNLEAMENEKTRIRSELYPVENAKMEEPISSKDMFDELKPEKATPKLEVGVKKSSVVKETEEEGSLSSWLKPKQFTIDDHIRNLQANSRKIPHSAKILADRPIIGMVAAHWNEDEPPRISPKWWDGNGIPNSTNKYKEDQKVSWHATPFEERLEKALSDESLISQGMHVNRTPMAFNESDESDTAVSQLRPSPHSKSVVSF